LKALRIRVLTHEEVHGIVDGPPSLTRSTSTATENVSHGWRSREGTVRLDVESLHTPGRLTVWWTRMFEMAMPMEGVAWLVQLDCVMDELGCCGRGFVSMCWEHVIK
jgi:hypothetical protein